MRFHRLTNGQGWFAESTGYDRGVAANQQGYFIEQTLLLRESVGVNSMRMSFDTRETLIQRLRKTDDAVAWDEFFALYQPLLKNFFRSRGIDGEDADDISQVVLQRISKAAPDFVYDPSKGKFRSWFFTIARNEMSRFFSKQMRRNEFEVIQETPRDAGEDGELEAFWDSEYRQHVFDWACREVKPIVSEKAWTAFWRTTIDGAAPQTVADELEVKLGTVYISKSRVISRLREQISSISGDGDEATGF